MDFNHRLNYQDLYNVSMLSLEGHLTAQDTQRLEKIRRAWNFYEGFHWEEIEVADKPQITENYCRPFVNKFVSFELGKSFTINYTDDKMKDVSLGDYTPLDYLNFVWNDNSKDKLAIELGQMKSITGDGWMQVKYFRPNELDDPFGEYPYGRIRIMVIPTNIVFPEYDSHDKEKLTKVTIMYPIEREDTSPVLKRHKISKIVYKQVWTRDTIEIWEGQNKLIDIPNKYKVIPFVQVKNFPVAGRETGISDLEDLIPLNTELNMKTSDVSEIIDYHSAPVTVVFGAKVTALEKGANKVWGGLPKDAKVQNLELNSDLGASVTYLTSLKDAMHDIGGVPKGALGGTQAISNTSGVALQFVNMPLIERTRTKRLCTVEGLKQINKLILHLGMVEGLITKPDSITIYDLFNTEIEILDTLPKDSLIELQLIEQELKLRLETRRGALQRLGKDNIDSLIDKIAKEDNIYLYLDDDNKYRPAEVNSGMTNGSTPVEQVRKENQGANMPTGSV